MFKRVIVFLFLSISLFGEAQRTSEITPHLAVKKAHEMLAQHPSFKEINITLGKRLLQMYCEEIDSLKIYFLRKDVQLWIQPSDEFVEKVIKDFESGNLEVFETILFKMREAITRNRRIEARVEKEWNSSFREGKKNVGKSKIRNFDWADTEEQLFERLQYIRAMQQEAASQLDKTSFELAIQRLQKRKAKYEEAREVKDVVRMRQTCATFVLKAFAQALDSESAYFTPFEAKQLLINMQQRLFGLGIVLRDDVDGFSIASIVEGGPAYCQGKIQLGDKIIAVNGQSVIGCDLIDVVERIRGEPNTPVVLKILRQKKGERGVFSFDVKLTRGKVVVRDMRYGITLEPYQDGVIVSLKLHSFYQDDETSSYADLLAVLEKVRNEHIIKGVVLDLRYNPGGLLNQAVAVSGLFIDKGIVVSVQDGDQNICHLRNITSKKVWGGPLVVLINRASASASEIVAQTLQDWGRAIVVGDDRSFGKGSFQLFTLCSDGATSPNPEGEYKITRGRYYTVSGRSPQLVGVLSDVIVPGDLSFIDIGEQFTKFPLSADTMTSQYEDSFADVSFFHKKLLERLYETGRENKSAKWTKYLPELRRMAEERLAKNKTYKEYLESLSKNKERPSEEKGTAPDFQLEEACNVLKDLVQVAEKT